jgi:antitoxin MazE
MKARLKVTLHQDGLAIDLPATMAAALQLQAGDEVEVEIASPTRAPLADRQALIPLRKYRGRMPADFKFDRHDANSR